MTSHLSVNAQAPYSRAMRSLAAGLLACVLTAQSGGQTSLRLTFRGPNGETIRPDRVTLMLDWWGGSEWLPMPVGENATTINFDLKRFPGGWTTPPDEPSRIL